MDSNEDKVNSNFYHGTISAKLAQYKPRRIHRYEAVNVLLLYWRDDDIGCASEAKQLSRLFQERFNYTVWVYVIPSEDSETSLGLRIAQFVNSFGVEDSLILVYYGGHGGPAVSTKSPCTWAAKITEGPSLDWSIIQPLLYLAASDVVIILDCCFAGQAARARPSQRVELLAATDKDQFTPTGTGKWPSFTKVLMKELEEMMAEDGVVTIPALHRRMVEARAGLRKQPFHVSLSGDGIIKLVRLELPTDGMAGPSLLNPPSALYLRLSLFHDLDFGTSTSLIKWMTKDSPPAIDDIQLVDQALSDAKEATDISKGLLGQDSSGGGKLLPYLSDEGRQEAHRLWHDLKATLSKPIPTHPTDSDVINAINNFRHKSEDLVSFVTDSLTRLNIDTLYNLESDKSSVTERLRKSIAMRLTLLNETLSDDDIRINFTDAAQDNQRLRLGRVDGKAVLVEYFYYDNTDRDQFALNLKHVRRIAALHAEAKSQDFRCLTGLGFFHENLHGSRFGFAYAIPDELRGRPFCFLSELITTIKIVPLELRAKVASRLCEALLQLHSIGWYHKNVKSDNVLVFGKSSSATNSGGKSFTYWDLENPYIIGFDCSRPLDAETRGTIDFSIKNNIYRHPERWGRPTTFQRYHDLYALGILLMEIGCWRTLPKMDNEKRAFEYIRNPEVLRNYLLRIAREKLAHDAGTKYSDVVGVCLDKRDWGKNEDWQSQRIIRQNILSPLREYIM